MGIKLYKKEKRVVEDVSNDIDNKVYNRLTTHLLCAAFDKTITRESIENGDDTFIEELLTSAASISDVNEIHLGEVVRVIEENMNAITASLYRAEDALKENQKELVDYRVKIHTRNALKFKQACLKNFGTGDESCKNLIRKFGKEIEKFEQQIKELHGKINN